MEVIGVLSNMHTWSEVLCSVYVLISSYMFLATFGYGHECDSQTQI